MTRHSRVSCSPTIRATALTGIAATMVMTNASNSKVKPLPGRAQGTVTVLMPHLSQRTRGARACIGLVLEEVEVAPGHPLGVIGRAVRRAAGRAGEAAARSEVNLDVEPVCLGVKVAAAHRPRWRQPQRQLQQSGVTHGWSPRTRPPARAWHRARRRQ